MKESVTILGLPFSRQTRKEALGRIAHMASEGKGTKVFTPNPQMLLGAYKQKDLRTLLSSADLLLPDGVGVTLAARLLGRPLSERITGIDTAEWLLSYGARAGLRFYFLGGREGVAEEAARRMKERYGELLVVGTHHGYFEKEGKENDAILEDIRRRAPHVLFVCFGFPAQEQWIAENLPHLPSVRLAMGLGGALDVWSGQIKRAPHAFQKLGLEWLWRALREPRRLKTVLSLPKFLLLVLTSPRKA